MFQIVPQEKPCDMRTKRAFGDVQLHLEFRTPAEVTDKSQGAWQNRATRMLMGGSRSVCRELPRMALAA